MYKAQACSLPKVVVIHTFWNFLFAMRTNQMCFFCTSLARDVLNELLVHDGHVVKDKFINAYVEVTNSYQLLRYT